MVCRHSVSLLPVPSLCCQRSPHRMVWFAAQDGPASPGGPMYCPVLNSGNSFPGGPHCVCVRAHSKRQRNATHDAQHCRRVRTTMLPYSSSLVLGQSCAAEHDVSPGTHDTRPAGLASVMLQSAQFNTQWNHQPGRVNTPPNSEETGMPQVATPNGTHTHTHTHRSE